MATRATYGFYSRSEFKPNTTIYIHWDGYEQGAAHYYLNAIVWAFDNDGRLFFTVEDFIRANESAELTLNHESRGDTQYRYDIVTQDRVGLDAYCLDDLINVSQLTDYGSDKWTVKSYTIRELITKYHAEKLQLLERLYEEKHSK